MEFGCLQNIVAKLIILKNATYEIIWNKIFYYFQIISICDLQKHAICEAKCKSLFYINKNF